MSNEFAKCFFCCELLSSCTCKNDEKIIVYEFKAKFTKYIPDILEDGILHVSKEYKTATHLCACGCKEKVVTPLKPRFWTFNMNEDKPTLSPSIGSFSLPCKSHYFITDGVVKFV